MKVIHVATLAASLPFLRGHIAFLRRSKVEVVSITSPDDALIQFGKELGIPVHAVEMKRKFSPLSDLVSLFRLWLYFSLQKPDVVHAHTPKAGLLAMIAARFAGVPVRIFQIHGLPYLSNPSWSATLLKLATWLSCQSATRVWSVSQSNADSVVQDSICPPEQIRVIANGSIGGVDAEGKFKPDRRIDHDNFTVLFIGRLANDKGIHELHQAWKLVRSSLPNARLLMAGEVDSRDGLKQTVLSDLGNEPGIELLGWVDNTVPLYSEADLVVLPSYREGLSTVLLEAAAMGLPSVASDVPGCCDVVENGITGTLIPPRNYKALANTILMYANNRQLARMHGDNGRQMVLRKYRPEPIWKETFDQYIHLCNDSRYRAGAQSRIKRCEDLLIASILLTSLAPLILVAAIAVRLKLGNPILFEQARPGRNGKEFTIYKFRTMSSAINNEGAPLPDGERLGWLGALLRRSSIDELPELWNVLRGEMSLVGPRPLLTKYTPYFSEEEKLRFCVRPGITGWAQIHGRNYSPWNERLANDVWYVNNWSLFLDIKILILTIGSVFAQTGVAVDANTVLPDLNQERSQLLASHNNSFHSEVERH